MRLVLDNNQYLANINTRIGNSPTPLLIVSRNRGFGYSKDVFSFLISRGASTMDRDRWGSSCLHFCLFYAGDVTEAGEVPLEREQAAITYLIQQGADVNAKKYDDTSVSDLARKSRPDAITGSYRQDLWDSVLAICGFNISEI
ncbi:hypothetical protein GQ53DRAFT_800850, partial [Thozetella sp. PMI_491]